MKLLQLNYFNLYESTTNFQTMLKIKILIISIVHYLHLVKNINFHYKNYLIIIKNQFITYQFINVAQIFIAI